MSETIETIDINGRLNLIKAMFDKKFNYTCKVSQCSYFVVGKTYGKREITCDYNINKNNQNITKINLEQLADMLDVSINENGEVETSINDENQFYQALLKTLKEQGMSYDDYKKQLSV